MSIANPAQLVEEYAKRPRQYLAVLKLDADDDIRFKKSGEFDRIRSELLTQFQNGVSRTSCLVYTGFVIEFCNIRLRYKLFLLRSRRQ